MVAIVRPSSPVLRIALGLWLAAGVALALRPPTPPRTDTPETGFSIVRASEAVGWIAHEPHSVGTEAHAAVGDRLARAFQDLGLSVEIQNGPYVDKRPGELRITQIRNVLARLRGTQSTRAVVLMAHYDSAVDVPGAADDGAGVAVLLETARVLASAAPLRNDVVFVATDGEEAGLCGARVFFAEHPRAREIGALINFEARGVSGPAILFETGERDGWLVRQFATAAPAPYASSLAPALYQHMGNATDLTVLRGSGVPRLNFAFADGWQSYHTPRDTPAAVDPVSIGHEGAIAVALARQLGSLDLPHAARDSSRSIYFNLGAAIVRYDERAAVPIALAAAAACGWLALSRRRPGDRRWRGVIAAVVAVLVTVVLAFLAARGAWYGLESLAIDRRALWDQGGGTVLAFVLLTVGIAAAAQQLLARVASADAVAIGAMTWFALAGLCAAVWLPGASYVFAWSMIAAAAVAWGARTAAPADALQPHHVLAIAAGSLVVLLVLVPAARMAYLALPRQPFLMVPVVAFATLMLAPLLERVGQPLSRWVAGAALLAAVATLAVVAARARHSGPPDPRGGPIYVLSLESSHASWLGTQPPRIVPASSLTPADVASRQASVPTWYRRIRLSTVAMSAAPLLAMTGPELSVDADTTAAATRTLALRLVSTRGAPEAAACFRSSGGIIRARTGPHELQIGAPPSRGGPAGADAPRCDLVVTNIGRAAAGVPITIDIPASATMEVQVADRSYQLAAAPASLAAAPASMLVTRRFHWSPAESGTRLSQPTASHPSGGTR